MPPKLLLQCLEVIRKYTAHILKNKIQSDMLKFRHIKKRYDRKKQLPIYTTCGYTVFKDENEEMRYYAFFLYNSLGIGISLTKWPQMYHTFDASFTRHQTFVTIFVDNNYVYFNHSSYFIYAWGKGKCAKRPWLEERGHHVRNRRVSRNIF